jgi:parvulin-like peptidyl-prolyl isomerase
MNETPPDLRAALFEQYLEDEVVLAASPQPSDRDLPPASRAARAREALTALCPPPALPTDAEVDDYVKKSAPAPSGGERIRLRQLVLPDRAVALKARERIRRGEDFAVVSRELSRAPNAAEGGMLGWVERGQLPPEFEAAVFGLAAGELSAPVASDAGWHVFQVMDRAASGGSEDPVARQRARTELATRRAEAARAKCLRALAVRVGVQVNCQQATFPCRNPFEEKS